MKTISIYRLTLLISLYLVFITGTIFITAAQAPVEIPRYNASPDISSKVIASNNSIICRMIPQVLEDVIYNSSCVILGEVVEEDSDIFYAKYHTIAKIKVLKTIAGVKPTEKYIYYRQMGGYDPNNVYMQTKVSKGDVCVFILQYNDFSSQYIATAFEESVFYVGEDKRLTSMSDQLICAKYDGIKIDVLEEDVKKISREFEKKAKS